MQTLNDVEEQFSKVMHRYVSLKTDGDFKCEFLVHPDTPEEARRVAECDLKELAELVSWLDKYWKKLFELMVCELDIAQRAHENGIVDKHCQKKTVADIQYRRHITMWILGSFLSQFVDLSNAMTRRPLMDFVENNFRDEYMKWYN